VAAEYRGAEDLTVVVTGSSSGVGLAAAEAFAQQGATVVLVGRHPGRLARAVGRVRDAGGGRIPRAYRADFARLDDVRQLAARLRTTVDRIDVLANNAGRVYRRYRCTVDGYEATLQANHLAPFLLTHLLRDRLTGGRVVNTASALSFHVRVDPDDLTRRGGRGYRMWRAYRASKQANVLFTQEAARRWPEIHSTAFHPGVVRTGLGRGTLSAAFFRLTPGLATPQEAAGTLIWLATTPTDQLVAGGYYHRTQLARPVPRATDPQLAARLWEASVAAVGL